MPNRRATLPSDAWHSRSVQTNILLAKKSTKKFSLCFHHRYIQSWDSVHFSSFRFQAGQTRSVQLNPVWSSLVQRCDDAVGLVLFRSIVLSLGSLSSSRLWCSIMFSFVQVKLHTVKSTKFLLHVNISIFLFFFFLFVFFFNFYTLSSLLFLSFFFCLQLWPQVLKVLESDPVKTPFQVVFDPGLVRVRSSSDVFRSGLYMALLIALHSISPWARLAWRCKAWLYVGVCARSDDKAICTNQFQSLPIGAESRTPFSRSFWSWKLPVSPLSEVLYFWKIYESTCLFTDLACVPVLECIQNVILD